MFLQSLHILDSDQKCRIREIKKEKKKEFEGSLVKIMEQLKVKNTKVS